MNTKVLYFVSHPIQYQAPLLRRISEEPDIKLKVIFESDFSTSSYFDTGFGLDLKWDTPLTDGYEYNLLIDIDCDQSIREADVVWFHGWQSSKFKKLLKLANKIGTPVLMRGENWAGAMPDGNGVKGWVKRHYLTRIFSRCDAFLAIGSANRLYYLEHGISSERIFLMPYAVDNSFFGRSSAGGSRRNLRQELGIDQNRKIILFAGKITQRKRPDLLLKAWQLANWHSGSRPALVFVGDGEAKPALIEQAERTDFFADVFFMGFRNQTELPEIYSAADVFVLGSEREPWGLAINEAMASGTAVIASDQCGAAFDLVNDSNGRVVQTGDVLELALALQHVIERSEDMGSAAKSHILNWSFDADVDGLKLALEYVG